MYAKCIGKNSITWYKALFMLLDYVFLSYIVKVMYWADEGFWKIILLLIKAKCEGSLHLQLYGLGLCF